MCNHNARKVHNAPRSVMRALCVINGYNSSKFTFLSLLASPGSGVWDINMRTLEIHMAPIRYDLMRFNAGYKLNKDKKMLYIESKCVTLKIKIKVNYYVGLLKTTVIVLS